MLEGGLAVALRDQRILGADLSHQRQHRLPRLRIQGVQLLRADHGRPSCRTRASSASAHPAIAAGLLGSLKSRG
jgi:hypothetical protein